MTFDSFDSLKSYILSKSQTAIKLAQEKIYLLIDRFVKEYYVEYTPVEYERTYQLFKSLVKTDIRKVGNGWVAEVYFDASKLDYQVKYLNGKQYPNPTGSAEKTLASAARGEHGGYKVGTAIWTDPLLILYKDGYDMLKKSLIDAGIPIR